MTLRNQNTISFLATANARESRTFYEKQIGLYFIEETDFALVFSVANSQLRIQKVSSISPAPYTAMGWQVDDIEKTVAALVGKGVILEHFDALEQDTHGIWISPTGAKIAWFKDPDGNTLSLTQR